MVALLCEIMTGVGGPDLMWFITGCWLRVSSCICWVKHISSMRLCLHTAADLTNVSMAAAHTVSYSAAYICYLSYFSQQVSNVCSLRELIIAVRYAVKNKFSIFVPWSHFFLLRSMNTISHFLHLQLSPERSRDLKQLKHNKLRPASSFKEERIKRIREGYRLVHLFPKKKKNSPSDSCSTTFSTFYLRNSCWKVFPALSSQSRLTSISEMSPEQLNWR